MRIISVVLLFALLGLVVFLFSSSLMKPDPKDYLNFTPGYRPGDTFAYGDNCELGYKLPWNPAVTYTTCRLTAPYKAVDLTVLEDHTIISAIFTLNPPVTIGQFLAGLTCVQLPHNPTWAAWDCGSFKVSTRAERRKTFSFFQLVNNVHLGA